MRFVFASLFCWSAFAAAPAQLLDTLPIQFEQGSSPVRWSAHGFGYAFSFTDQATFMQVGDRAARLTFPGANPAARFEAAQRALAPTNYFIGKQARSVPGFRRLRRIGVYPGIDVIYYGQGRQVEYDFEVAPGADPSRIRMRFDGADAVRLNERGEIVLTLGAGEVTQHAPVVYQRGQPGETVTVEASYRIDAEGTVRLALGKYDTSDPLVVDPTITFASYLEGSTGADAAIAISHDSRGLMYLAGYTYSTDFPTIGDSYKHAITGSDRDIWVMQLNRFASPGEYVVYSSYIGGTALDDLKAMTVDTNGVIYICGLTRSTDFPTTPGAFQAKISADTHAFVAMLDPFQPAASSLVYSTVLGGTGPHDEADGIAVAGGKIYVTGLTNSRDFPVGAAYQPALLAGYDAFVTELDPSQSGGASLIASTYLGGSSLDAGRAIAVDAAGKVYVAGVTYSSDFPMTATAYQHNYSGNADAFLAELDLGAATVVYSTFLGGSAEDEVKKIVIEPSGRVGLTGYTFSSDFPVTQGAFQTTFGGNGNAIFTILDLTKGRQGLAYSTYFGGTGGEVAYDLHRESDGKYYLGGYTMSPDLPVTANALNRSSGGGGVDGFLAVIDPAAPPLSSQALVYSSYITSPGFQIVYGVDVDPFGSVFATGYTSSNVFPDGASQNSYVGKYGGFLLALTLP